jgi:hypothetical protein
MANHINFEAKSDRELLVLVAQQTNALTEQRIPGIEHRVSVVENECKKRAKDCAVFASQAGYSSKKTLAAGAGVGGGSLAILYLIAKIVAAIFGVEL